MYMVCVCKVIFHCWSATGWIYSTHVAVTDCPNAKHLQGTKRPGIKDKHLPQTQTAEYHNKSSPLHICSESDIFSSLLLSLYVCLPLFLLPICIEVLFQSRL